VEGLQNYFRLKKLALRLAEEARDRRIDLAILIDYPGFNLYLAALLSQMGIRVVQVVSPQLWAWRYGRIKKIKRYVTLMLTLFKFEKDLYEKEQVAVEWIGHPLLGELKGRLRSGTPVKKSRSLTIALLPGSRRSEVMRLLDPMLQAARLIKEKKPELRLLLPNVSQPLADYIQNRLNDFPDLDVAYSYGNSLNVMEASDMVILASGTATMEAAALGKPMVILYRISWLNFLIASIVLRTRYIGMVNLLARRQVAPELLQTEVHPEAIARETLAILADPARKKEIMLELEHVRRELGRGVPARKAADAILKLLLPANSGRAGRNKKSKQSR
jgi:lipid-A-disaccharide synthase